MFCHGVSNTSRDAHGRAREAFAAAIVVQASVMPPQPLEPMPFHLRIVECLLEETSKFFHKKVERWSPSLLAPNIFV